MTGTVVVPLVGNERVRSLADAAQRVVDPKSWNEFRTAMNVAHAWAKMQENFYALRRELLLAEVEALRNVHAMGAKGLPKEVREAAEYYAGLNYDEIDRLVRENVIGPARAVGIARRQLADVQARQRGQALASTGTAWDESYVALEDVRKGLGKAIREAVDLAAEGGRTVTIGEIARDALSSADLDIADPALYEGALYVCRKAIQDTPVEWAHGTDLPRLLTVRLPDGDIVRVPLETATVRHLRNMLAYREEHLRGYVQAVEKLRDLVESLEGVAPSVRLCDAFDDGATAGAA